MLHKTNIFIFALLTSSMSLASDANYSSDTSDADNTSNTPAPKPPKEMYDKMYKIWNNCNFANWLRINNNDLYHSQYSCDNWETVKTVYQKWLNTQPIIFTIAPDTITSLLLTNNNREFLLHSINTNKPRLELEMNNPKAAFELIEHILKRPRTQLSFTKTDIDTIKKILSLIPKKSLEWINPETKQSITNIIYCHFCNDPFFISLIEIIHQQSNPQAQ